MVMLRDGKKYVGVLRSYDQYGNILLHEAVERVYIGQQYGEQLCGVFLIRGENITMLCEIDEAKYASMPLEERPMIEMLTKQREAIEESRRLYRLKRQIHRDFGTLVDADIASSSYLLMEGE
jgi:U6 snRNA-associated Sm-like protein LSm1